MTIHPVPAPTTTAPIRITPRIRIPHRLAPRIPRERSLQAPDPEHIRPHGAERTHLLPDAITPIPCRLRPLHAARVSSFAAAALPCCRDAAGGDVGPDLAGEGWDELRGDGEPAQGVAFEGEAVCVAVALWLAGGFDGDVGVVGEEFGESVVQETFEGGQPFGVFGLVGGRRTRLVFGLVGLEGEGGRFSFLFLQVTYVVVDVC